MTERFLYLECIGVFGVTVYLSYLNILVRLYRDMIVFLHLQYDGGFVDVIHIAFKRLRSGYHAYAVVGCLLYTSDAADEL